MLAFHVESDNQRLLIRGDVANTMSYRSNGPSFDDIKDLAITSRKRILDMVATDAFGIGRCVAVSFLGDISQRGNRYRLLLFAVPDRWQPLTAAHRNLPFGTHARVTRLDTGTPIVVRVNDRGPFIKGRIIDLSRAAAARLGMLGKGIVRVRIEVVPPPTLTAELHSAASTPCGPCRQPLLLERVSTAPCDRSGTAQTRIGECATPLKVVGGHPRLKAMP